MLTSSSGSNINYGLSFGSYNSERDCDVIMESVSRPQHLVIGAVPCYSNVERHISAKATAVRDSSYPHESNKYQTAYPCYTHERAENKQQQQQQLYSTNNAYTDAYSFPAQVVDDDDFSPLCYFQEQNIHTHVQQRPVTKRVQFAEDALLYSSDRTRDEVRRSWYDKDELASFKRQRKAIVSLIKKNKFNLNAIDQTVVCLRGFEAYFSPEMNKAQKQSRERSIKAVCGEHQKLHCPESLQEAAEVASQWARNNALELGAMDAIESFVLNYLSCDSRAFRLNDPIYMAQKLYMELRFHCTPNQSLFSQDTLSQLTEAVRLVQMQ